MMKSVKKNNTTLKSARKHGEDIECQTIGAWKKTARWNFFLQILTILTSVDIPRIMSRNLWTACHWLTSRGGKSPCHFWTLFRLNRLCAIRLSGVTGRFAGTKNFSLTLPRI